jgi:hypothetical protein
MVRIKCSRRNIQIRIVIVMVLLCLIICTVNVQFYLERQVAVNIVTHRSACSNKMNQQQNYFNMPLNELLDVVVISQPKVRPSSHLLNFCHFYPVRLLELA